MKWFDTITNSRKKFGPFQICVRNLDRPFSKTMSPKKKNNLTEHERREEQLLRHAMAQHRNLEALRDQARERMRLHCAAVKADEWKKTKIAEWRRDTDADYREWYLWRCNIDDVMLTRRMSYRQQQKWKIHQEVGKERFKQVYLPLYRIHGNKTGMLPFAKECKAEQERRIATLTAMGPPHSLSVLSDPPQDFVVCTVLKHMDANFDNHFDFSCRRNRTYWILFFSDKQGLYSLKTSCVAALGKTYGELEAVGSFNTLTEVLAAWAKHCYHRHGKCRCWSACHLLLRCPKHSLELDLSTANPRPKRWSVKKEASVAPKREGSASASGEGGARESAPLRASPPPSYKGDSDSASSVRVSHPRSLFAPDTDEEEDEVHMELHRSGPTDTGGPFIDTVETGSAFVDTIDARGAFGASHSHVDDPRDCAGSWLDELGADDSAQLGCRELGVFVVVDDGGYIWAGVGVGGACESKGVSERRVLCQREWGDSTLESGGVGGHGGWVGAGRFWMGCRDAACPRVGRREKGKGEGHNDRNHAYAGRQLE
ncbi:hypothetical protein DFH06DRAFT_1149909 [Mycena polygramma]|nr:hypothetical protein DFH06DRAFT_1149909 [Mycena polygramma]